MTFFFRNVDQTFVFQNKKGFHRDRTSETFYKEITHAGKVYLQTWNRYYFCVPLNHGLARETDSLPANVPVVIRFHRAPASYSVIKLQDDMIVKLKTDNTETIDLECKLDENVLSIKNPVLSAYYAFSPELEQKMSKVRLYNYEIEYDDYVVRRNVLDGGLSDYDINLVQGKLPKYIIFGLSTLERLSGDETLSLTCFQQQSLKYFDLLLGNFYFVSEQSFNMTKLFR